jgi:hypothetical protein
MIFALGFAEALGALPAAIISAALVALFGAALVSSATIRAPISIAAAVGIAGPLLSAWAIAHTISTLTIPIVIAASRFASAIIVASAIISTSAVTVSRALLVARAVGIASAVIASAVRITPTFISARALAGAVPLGIASPVVVARAFLCARLIRFGCALRVTTTLIASWAIGIGRPVAIAAAIVAPAVVAAAVILARALPLGGWAIAVAVVALAFGGWGIDMSGGFISGRRGDLCSATLRRTAGRALAAVGSLLRTGASLSAGGGSPTGIGAWAAIALPSVARLGVGSRQSGGLVALVIIVVVIAVEILEEFLELIEGISDVGKMEECVLALADIDEGGVHPLDNALDIPQKDRSDPGFLVRYL